MKKRSIDKKKETNKRRYKKEFIAMPLFTLELQTHLQNHFEKADKEIHTAMKKFNPELLDDHKLIGCIDTINTVKKTYLYLEDY